MTPEETKAIIHPDEYSATSSDSELEEELAEPPPKRPTGSMQSRRNSDDDKITRLDPTAPIFSKTDDQRVWWVPLNRQIQVILGPGKENSSERILRVGARFFDRRWRHPNSAWEVTKIYRGPEVEMSGGGKPGGKSTFRRVLDLRPRVARDALVPVPPIHSFREPGDRRFKGLSVL